MTCMKMQKSTRKRPRPFMTSDRGWGERKNNKRNRERGKERDRVREGKRSRERERAI